MLTYIICPYNHKDRLVRTARFKAVSDLMKNMLLQGTPVFSEAVYIHAILEANPDLSYESFNWLKILKPFRKMATKVVFYQLPGWQQDSTFTGAYNQFISWGEDITIQGAYPEHLTGAYREVWEKFNLK